MHTASPIARAAEPFKSFRFGSHVAKTVKTSSKVMKISTTRACPTDRLEFTCTKWLKLNCRHHRVNTCSWAITSFLHTNNGHQSSCFSSKTKEERPSAHHSYAKASSYFAGCDQVKNSSPCCGSQTLCHHVEYSLGQAQLPGDYHGCCDGRVDVSTADVAEALHHGGNTEAKAERYQHQVSRRWVLLPRGPVDGRANAKEHKNQRGQELCRHSPPKVFGPDPFECHHGSLQCAGRRAPAALRGSVQWGVDAISMIKARTFTSIWISMCNNNIHLDVFWLLKWKHSN